jgi:hypothetical protein
MVILLLVVANLPLAGRSREMSKAWELQIMCIDKMLILSGFSGNLRDSIDTPENESAPRGRTRDRTQQ